MCEGYLTNFTGSVPEAVPGFTYDAEGQIATWTQQTNVGPAKVFDLGYDAVNQLASAVLRSNDVTGIILKKHAYTYDNAGNRMGEQIDGNPSLASHNELNQLTNVMGGGPLRFAGNLSETGAVSVAGSPAVMSGDTNFTGWASVGIGTNIVPLIAVDVSDNWRTNDYEVVVSNNVVSRTLNHDLNGNLTFHATGYNTNTYGPTSGFPGPNDCGPFGVGRVGRIC